MKTLLVITVLCLTTASYAATFTKLSDTVMQKTEVKEVTDNITLNSLKAQKTSLEQQKLDYNANIDAQIAEIDAEIAEAIKLGIKEITEIGNIQ